MKAINFEQVNKVLKADGCHDLPVCWTGSNIVVCWRLSLWERLKLVLTGKLWHLIWSERAMIQPVLLAVDVPFEHRKMERLDGPLHFSETGATPEGFPFTANCVITQWNVPDDNWGRKTEIQLINSGRYVSMPHCEMLNHLHRMED